MIRSPRAIAVLLVASVQAFAQSIVAGWFAIHAGDRWTYEHETRDDTGGVYSPDFCFPW